MPRAASNSDAFNAVAEPRRREILEYLAGGEREDRGEPMIADRSQSLVLTHVVLPRQCSRAEIGGAGDVRLPP